MNSVFLIAHPGTIDDLVVSRFAAVLPSGVAAYEVGEGRHSAEQENGRVYFQLNAEDAYSGAELREIAARSGIEEPHGVLEILYSGYPIYDVLKLLSTELPGAVLDLDNGVVGTAAEVGRKWDANHPIHTKSWTRRLSRKLGFM